MKVDKVLDICQTGFDISKLKFKRKGYKYLTWAGIASWTFALGYAIYATSEKLPQIQDDHEFALANAYKKPTEKEQNREIACTYKDTIVDLTVAYAPTVIGAAVGTICILSSDHVQEQFTNQLLAECCGLKMVLDGYRDRWRKKVGAQEEYDVFHDIQRGEVIEETVDEKGKKHTEKKEVITHSIPGDKFTVFFGADTGNANYIKGDPEANGIFVDETTTMLNRMLFNKRQYGYFDAEAVYKAYGIDVDTLVQMDPDMASLIHDYGIINDGKSKLEVRTSPSFGQRGGDDETYLEFNFVHLGKAIDDYQQMLKERCDHAKLFEKK